MSDKELAEFVAAIKAAEIEQGRKPINWVDAWDGLNNALVILAVAKPNDKSPLDRRFAVTITELEKAIAYFNTYVAIPSKAEVVNG